MIIRYLILLCCGLQTLSAFAQTAGQYEVRKRRTDGKYDSFGVTLLNGQSIGQLNGVPAPITGGGGGSTAWADITGTPTTRSGYGITDAEGIITAGTTSQYWRGDKSWQTLNAAAVGLGSVENTALSTWAGTTNITTINSTQSISRLSNFTTNGFLKVSASDGTLVVDTNTYITGSTSVGGNGGADGGKVVKFNGYGGLNASADLTFYAVGGGTTAITVPDSVVSYSIALPQDNGTLALTSGNISGTAAGLSATLAVSSGGTGQTTWTNGQIPIGNSTGNTLSKSTLTAGTGITITNGAGSITIAAAPPLSSIGGLGTNVSTALAIAVGSNGGPVVYNGAGGTPSAINLTNGTALPLSTGVSGDLPLANLAQSSAASKLLGRGDSGAGDYQEITLGSGLTMIGATLSASGGLSAPTLAGINSITSATGQDLILATLDSSKDIVLTPHGTGQVVISAGTAAKPGLSLGQSNTGLSAETPSRLVASANGATAMTFYSTGIGVGTGGPLFPDADDTVNLGLGGSFNLRFKTLYLSRTVNLKGTTTPTPLTGAADVYSKIISGVAEVFVLDEAGNETQISPHSRIAPESMYDSPFDDITWSANYYTGIIVFTHQPRLAAGQADSKFYETFEEHIQRLGDDCDPLVKAGIWDWDAVKKAEADESQAAHDLWLERKTAWLALPENAGKPFAEREPEIIIPKPLPKFIADQIAGKAAFLAARPTAGVSVKMTSMRLALIDAQLLQPVLNVLEAMPDPVEKLKAKQWWDTAQNVTRNHPLVLSLAIALGQSPEQVDALFQAAKLKDAAP